jgi:thiol-disulfide isomerase/thioredoxin
MQLWQQRMWTWRRRGTRGRSPCGDSTTSPSDRWSLCTPRLAAVRDVQLAVAVFPGHLQMTLTSAIVYDFTSAADHSGPCRSLKPIVGKLADEYADKVGRLWMLSLI